MLTFLFLTTLAWAQPQLSCENLFASETILYSNQNPLSFSQVEVFRRNNDIGLQQQGEIKLVQWSELTFEFGPQSDGDFEVANIIGLSEKGQLFHLIKFENRTIARLLSGDLYIDEFQLSNKGRLLAWNSYGESLIYRPELWNKSPRKKVLQTWLKYWGLTTTTVVAGKLIFLPDINFTVEVWSYNMPLPMFEFFISSVVGLSSGFAMLSKYEHHNTYPNGFVLLEKSHRPFEWLLDSTLLKLNANNLDHFANPNLNQLSPALHETEDIR